MVLAAYRKSALLRCSAHLVRLGLARRRPYSADGANLTMMDPDSDVPQPRIPLLITYNNGDGRSFATAVATRSPDYARSTRTTILRFM